MTEAQANVLCQRRQFRWGEIAGLLGLVALTIGFLCISWRKWPDPLIDFGMELYTPWRLANGAVLYRDVDCFYGPLSKYFNAAVFTLFKPGLMVLVMANLIVFGAILTTLYFLLRGAWGRAAALAASAVCIAVFGFSQLVATSNYNYATPYSHESTHGLLLCLVLTLVLTKWMERPTRSWSFLAGTLFGLTALLKSEILLAAGVVTCSAAFVACRYWRRPSASAIAAWAAGALLPTAGFTAHFLLFLPFKEALSAACRGWLNVVATSRFTGVEFQIDLLGLDQPWTHFQEHALATLVACLAIGLITGAAWLSERIQHRGLSVIFWAALAGAMASFAFFLVNWWSIGRCLLGLVLLYLLGVSVFRRKTVTQDRHVKMTRLLIAILAAMMMARMILNGRIYHFGFYQAALAAMVVTAVLIGELPGLLGFGRKGKITMIVGSLALLFPGAIIVANTSAHQLRAKTLSIGEGVDRFYAFPEQVEPTGRIVSVVIEALAHEGGNRTLLVLPEGAMINYLARFPSTVAPFNFFSSSTERGGEEQIVSQLNQRPPDLVVIISRDLREYGIDRYGESVGSGALLLRWVDKNYTRIGHVGDDFPLDYRSRGAVLLKRK